MNQDNQHIKKFDNTRIRYNNKLFLKWDFLIIIFIVIILIISSAFIINNNKGEYVEIYYKGQLIEKHSLQNDVSITITKKGTNNIVIDSGKVYMNSSTCTNQICVHSSAITKIGQRIVCVPNGIVVVIVGKDKLDGIIGGQDVN